MSISILLLMVHVVSASAAMNLWNPRPLDTVEKGVWRFDIPVPCVIDAHFVPAALRLSTGIGNDMELGLVELIVGRGISLSWSSSESNMSVFVSGGRIYYKNESYLEQIVTIGKPIEHDDTFFVFDAGHITSYGNGYSYQMLWFSTGMNVPVSCSASFMANLAEFRFRTGITFTNSPYDWTDSGPLTTWLGPDVSIGGALVFVMDGKQ